MGALALGLAAAGSPRAAASSGGAAAARAGARAAALSIGSGDSPAGFWYGTDSWTVSGTGSAPYKEPVIGGAYGGYIGMAGNWARRAGCGDSNAWSGPNSQQATTNFRTYHLGIGTGVYWFMGGPGVDPHYHGTTGEASAWGRTQAAWALSNIHGLGSRLTYPVVFEDVEEPGYAPGISPAADNGWNSVYTSPCSGRVKSSYISPSVDRAVFNGFASYITSHSAYKVGVYSSPPIWTDIFGTGTASLIPNTYEWTYLKATTSLARHPSGWCLSGTSTCAQFFGGIGSGSKYALMWQWSGGGGYYNGHGDFDQIDANRTP